MAGHNKWSKIKRGKAVEDAKRGAVFTKIGNQIAIAARAGTDPSTNSALAMAIEKAKAANMPGSNIDKAIARVADKSAAQLQEVLYEGYGPGGTAILVECATDNTNRTYPEVRNAFNKHGGSIADKGSVAFQFTRKGVIIAKANGDEFMLMALDADAEDVQEDGGESIVYTAQKDLAKVRDSLKEAGIELEQAELSYEPNNVIEITDDVTIGKIERLMDALDDLDDVSNTYTNFEIKG
jgi:YebC/PmpR family DNA-binding regulatory protein